MVGGEGREIVVGFDAVGFLYCLVLSFFGNGILKQFVMFLRAFFDNLVGLWDVHD